MRQWNFKSVFYELEWSLANDLSFFKDAFDLACGCVLQSSWTYGPFSDDRKKRSIAWRELYALLVACATWGKRLVGKKILVNCDNTAIVESVNKGSCKCPAIMSLIRELFFVAANHNFECKLRYIPSKKNVEADLLSRLKIRQFQKQFPRFDRLACKSSVVNVTT